MIDMRSTANTAHPRSRAAVIGFLALFAWAAILASPGGAQPLNPYKVTGIKVEATAETTPAAKRKAIEEGWRKAIEILLRRITLSQDHARLPKVTDEQLSGLKEGFEIDSENTTPTGYRGDITYRFRAAAVGSLLKGAEITYIETPSKPVLVLAVYKSGAVQNLWDEPNPWRQAWSNLDWRNGLVEFALPRADLADLRAIDAAQAVAADKVALAKIAATYGAGEVLIAFGQGDDKRLVISVRRFNVLAQTLRPLRSVTVLNPDSATLVRAARRIAGEYEDAWKRSNLVVSGEQSTITARVPIANLPYWIKLRSALGSVRVLRSHRVASLTRTEATVELTYVGELAQLQTALQQSDLVLVKTGTDAAGQDIWTLTIAGAIFPNADKAQAPAKNGATKKPGAE